MKKSKITALAVASALTATVLLAGTFAWRSISQEVTNEVVAGANPGARLHDDFNGTNKDIYVENFTSEAEEGAAIYARIKLTEYLETGTGAGIEGGTATPLIPGTDRNKKADWTVYRYGEKNEFRDYYDWVMGGSTSYMPTFNKNKDSLEADVNGTLAGNENGAYGDYVDYTDVQNQTDTRLEIYDADDTDDEDEGQKGTAVIPNETILKALGATDENSELNGAFNTTITAATEEIMVDLNGDKTAETRLPIFVETDKTGNIVAVYVDLDGTTADTENEWDIKVVANVEHTVQPTLNTENIMTMAEWIAADCPVGPYWVYDADGWAYWAQGIEPGKTTGCLLNGINRNSTFVSEHYYAINVVAQFATAGDWGAEAEDPENSTGFYKGGETVSAEAMRLLNTITFQPKSITVTAVDETETGVTPETPLQMKAEVMQGGLALDEPVKWSITSVVKSADTRIGETTGLLTVGQDEEAEFITVTATLKKDETVKTNYTVKVGTWNIVTVSTIDDENYAAQGKTRTLKAMLETNRGGNVDTTFTWKLAENGGYATGTSIVASADTSTAELTVDAEETNSTITVEVTCEADGIQKTGEYNVNVITQLAYIEYMDAGTTETVTIDNIEWYVLRKGETEEDALLWSVDALGSGTEFGSSSKWESSSVRNYLNSTFLDSLSTLSTVAKTTALKTRSGYTSSTFTDSEDTVFLFSEADIFGTFNEGTASADDYTIKDAEGNGIKVLEAVEDETTMLLPGNGTYWYWLRSPRMYDYSVAICWYDGADSDAYYGATEGYLRPALWIDLSLASE